MLPSPVTAAVIAPFPTATFLLPVVRPVRALKPTAVLSSPSVTASRAVKPTAVLFCASFNVPVVSWPSNIDPVKPVPPLFPSVKSSIALTPEPLPFAVQERVPLPSVFNT